MCTFYLDLKYGGELRTVMSRNVRFWAPGPRPCPGGALPQRPASSAYHLRWNSCFCSSVMARGFFFFIKPNSSRVSFSQEARSGFLASRGP